MPRFRFTIGSLIGFVVICAVAFAALKESSDWWERGTFTLTLLVLLTSVLLASHRTGARRAYWLGFALFGCVYLGLSLIPPVESRLVTSPGLAYLYSKLPGQSPQRFVLRLTTTAGGNVNQPIQSATLSNTFPQNTASSPVSLQFWDSLALVNSTVLTGSGSSPENFVKIGHSLVALLLAWFGGILSRRLSRRSRPLAGGLQDTAVDPMI